MSTNTSNIDKVPVGLNTKIEASRQQLVTIWGSKRNDKSTATECRDKWNNWSVAVRSDYVKRAQAAIIAGVQTSVPRKQWSQWEVTLKFCLDDIFAQARSTTSSNFDDGIGKILVMVVNGKENELNPQDFDRKIVEMMAEMKAKNGIAGFDPADKSHSHTLRAIRSLYSIEWAAYLISRLITAN